MDFSDASDGTAGQMYGLYWTTRDYFPCWDGIKDIFGALICGGELLGEKNTVFFILFIRKVLFCPNFSILLR